MVSTVIGNAYHYVEPRGLFHFRSDIKKNLNTIDHVIFDLCNVHNIFWQVGNHEAIFLSSTIQFFLIQAMFIHWTTGLPVIFIIMATFEEAGVIFHCSRRSARRSARRVGRQNGFRSPNCLCGMTMTYSRTQLILGVCVCVCVCVLYAYA